MEEGQLLELPFGLYADFSDPMIGFCRSLFFVADDIARLEIGALEHFRFGGLALQGVLGYFDLADFCLFRSK
jgi:hypothetical protein